MRPRVAVAMSGGVDSSAAALLLKQEGHELLGLTMELFDQSGTEADDARSVADRLGFPHRVCDLSQTFRTCVMDPFAAAYEAGQTPNPCIQCNRCLKFGALLEQARAFGCEKLATGHYVRLDVDPGSGRWLLKKALHPEKDQSYVLYTLTQDQLAAARFPLGGLSKEEIRSIAAEAGLVNAKKRDSQDICFVPDGDYGSFIEKHTGKTFPPGNFTDKDGNILGTHKGMIRYTIGQRKGLGLALPAPGYVCKKCMDTNCVIIGSNDDLFTKELTADDFNWIAYPAPAQPVRIKAKTRYRHTEQPATAAVLEDGRVRIVFDEPQRAITKGQAVVLYDGDTVIGGGTITETEE